MKAKIISIGNEVLTGDTLDTNSTYFAQKLTELGFNIVKIISIDDDYFQIQDTISYEKENTDLILITGGLGPTKDDMTREGLAGALGLKLQIFDDSLSRIKSYFSSDEEAVDKNKKQALFPPSSKLLPNSQGTADGFILSHGKTHYIVLPGPPRENKEIFESYAISYLKELSQSSIVSKFYRIFGIGEWKTEASIQDLVNGPDYVATFAKEQGLFIKVSLDSSKYEDQEERFTYYENKISDIFGDKFLSIGVQSPEELLSQCLIKNKLSVSCAESITGGLLASKLISIPGISANLQESFITYSDEAKENILSVSKRTLEDYSAVSKEVAVEMLKGLEKISSTDLQIVTTGYAGPDGNPPGLVFVGVKFKDEIKIISREYKGSRNRIRERTANDGILNAYQLLSKLGYRN